MRLGILIVRIHHVFLSPLVILSLPPSALFNQNLLLATFLSSLGLGGMLLNRRAIATATSLSLLGLLIWGKLVTDVLKIQPPDTAVLLLEFTAVLALMEASSAILTFTRDFSGLKQREDELSSVLSQRLRSWLRNQLSTQARFSLAALSISIGLLPVAGLTSLPSNQLVFSGTLALLAVVLLMFLTIYRREPEAV